jgi:hypothetical protein
VGPDQGPTLFSSRDACPPGPSKLRVRF